MKLRIRDRILSALAGIVLIICAVSMILWLLGILPLDQFLSNLTAGWLRWAGIGVCAVLILLGLSGVGMLFRRRKDKGVVVQHTEYGDMSISMKAMENMVKRCVDAHPELNVNQTRIFHSRGGISVDIKITLMNGVNIPLTVNALQKQIKQYITSCSGVDVEEVRVMVETEAAKRLPAPEVVETPAVVEAPVPAPVEKAAECICQHKEEPATYAKTPAEEETSVQLEEVIPEAVEEAAEADEAVCEEEAQEPAEETNIQESADESEEADSAEEAQA